MAVIVVILIAVVAVYVMTPSTTTSTTTSTSVTATVPSTLVIDDAAWPFADLNTLNPAGDWPQWGYFDVYQPMVYVNDSLLYQVGTVQYLPGLAVNWTVSPDGTLYTFNLRKGVTFSNGDPYNAYQEWMQLYSVYYLSGNTSAFIAGYDIMYDHMATASFGPSTITLINETLGGLINPSQNALGIMMNSSWPIYVTGPYQIVFHLLGPFSYFPSVLVDSTILLSYDMQWVLDHGGFGTPVSPSTFLHSNAIPGTGPYMITGMSEKAWISYTQNPNYWGRNLTQAQIQANPLLDPGHVKNVMIFYKTDDLARYTDLVKGTAQIVAIESPNWPLIRANPDKFSYVKLPPWAEYSFGISLNTQLYPTNITAFRQAIVHAINYTDFNQKVFFGTATQYVAPFYPAFSQFYDLGNFTNYQFNLTLAQHYLAQAHITNMPTLTIRIIAGCDFCSVTAQVIQADLSQLNITSNIVVLESSDYYTPYGNYETNLANAAQMGQISIVGGETFAPDALNPVDNWVTTVSDGSAWGNWAVYNNPVVQACTDAFFNGTSTMNLQSICAKAQARIYNDAPYVYFSVGLWWIDGSVAWLRSGPVNSFLMDPIFSGEDSAPLFNTVTFQTGG
jgi:ABC-type transport system substrate-binding protein